MGLDDFKTNSLHEHKAFNHTELDEKLESIVEECQERFPKEVQVDFIEASPQLKKHAGMAYRRSSTDEDGNFKYSIFIRIKKSLAEKGGTDLKMVILHEMVHCYMYQHGIDASEKSVAFQWMCGRVMGDPSDIFKGDKEWDKVIQPFIDEEFTDD